MVSDPSIDYFLVLSARYRHESADEWGGQDRRRANGYGGGDRCVDVCPRLRGVETNSAKTEWILLSTDAIGSPHIVQPSHKGQELAALLLLCKSERNWVRGATGRRLSGSVESSFW